MEEKMPTAKFRRVEMPTPDDMRQLERELYSARQTIIDLMPPPVRRILTGMYGCETRDGAYRWRDTVIKELIELSTETNPETSRAHCPLCNGSASSPYVEGFALPEGLRRHL